MTKKIGVLALQGAVTEHLQALTKLGVTATAVKSSADLEGLDGLIIPGGESTAIGRLIREQHLEEPLRKFYGAGKAIFGTCAGLILCSTDSNHAPDELRLGFIDIAVERNGFGRQVDSFEVLLPFEGIAEPVEAVFIRAPYIHSVGKGVRVLASIEGKIVAAENDQILVTAFHPELTDDLSVFEYFLKKVE
jgi:5'-phosphate synthase pdxT subunit